MPDFTIVTPSFNHAPYVAQAVRSVLGQLDDPGIDADYVVADAGSRDESIASIAAAIRGADRATCRVRPDRGPADALRREFRHAKGDILGWVSADDLMLPNCLKKVARAFERSGADVVYGRGYFIDERGDIVGSYPTRSMNRWLLRRFCYISQPSAFVTRQAYEQVGGIDPDLKYCFDYDLWLRLSESGARFTYVDEFLSATRLHPSTKTSERTLAFTDEILGSVQRTLNEVPDEWAIYRAFRARDLQRPASAKWMSFLSAVRAGRPTPATARWIVGFAAAMAMAYARALPKRLARRRLAA